MKAAGSVSDICQKMDAEILFNLDKLGKPCDRDIHLKGFLNQVKDLGIVFAPEQKISGCENIKELEEKLRSLLEKNSSIDAVVARYDELAAVALSVARRWEKKKCRMICR